MSGSDPNQPNYLIVADHDRSVFAVEGPMTDDRRWQAAAREARSHQHRITCGPSGPDRDVLATPGQAQDFLSAHAFIHGHFHPQRHLMAATAYRSFRSEAFNIWQQETCDRYTT